MIGLQSKVNIIDNSGAIEGRCIKILSPKQTKSGDKQKNCGIGDLILISVTKALSISPSLSSTSSTSTTNTTTGKIIIKKGSLFKALIVRTKKESKYILNNNTTMSQKSELLSITNSYNIRESSYIKTSKNLLINITPFDNFDTHSLNFKKLKYNSIVLTESFNDNAVVLVKITSKTDMDYTPIGTRIKGPISKQLKNRQGCAKLISITS
jgi:ribosomal protein L14